MLHKLFAFVMMFVLPVMLMAPSSTAFASPQTRDGGPLLRDWAARYEGVSDARIVPKKAKGHYVAQSSVEDTALVGSTTFTAYFKHGLLAYDGTTNESWPVFATEHISMWPRLLKVSEPFLVIGYGEGVAIVNLKTNWFYRFAFAKNDPFFDLVSLSIENGKVIVNDHQFEVDLSTLKN